MEPRSDGARERGRGGARELGARERGSYGGSEGVRDRGS